MQKWIAKQTDFLSQQFLGKRLLVSYKFNKFYQLLFNVCQIRDVNCNSNLSFYHFTASNLHVRPAPSDYKDLNTQNDRNVKVVDGALVLKNIQKSHEGYYLCKASNGIGGISAVAKLSVQGNIND